jgi:hypothetical protein
MKVRPNMFVADIGKGRVHIYDSSNDKFYGKLPVENLVNLNIDGLKRGDILIIEESHLRESHKYTLAQPYSYEQLVQFKENCEQKEVEIRLFPQGTTPTSRKLAGLGKDDKSDEADTKAIASFLLQNNSTFNTLKKFAPTRLKDFQENNKSIFNYIKLCNEDLNPAKTSGYGFDKEKDPDYEDEVSKWIKKYTVDGGASIDGYTDTIADYLNYDEELLNLLGLSYSKKTGQINIETANRIYTLVNSILRPNGELRFRPDLGLVPNWKYIKAHYLGCKPYHRNQGVAASNYKHWLRIAVSEYAYPGKKHPNTSDFQVGISREEYLKLKKARTKVDKMTQKIWYTLRKMIVEEGLR